MMSVSFSLRMDNEQLLMIQRGESCSLRYDNKKLRLVDEAFRRQVRELDQSLVISSILAEIASGRVIIEIKDADGKISAITSKALENHEKAKKYEKLEVKDSSFFEELVKLAKESLDIETTHFKAEEKKATADQQRQVQKDSQTPLPFVSHHIVTEAKDDHFIQAPGIKKITQRMVEDAIEQARRSQADKIQQQKQQKRKREKQIDKDNRLFERNQEFSKSSIVK